MRLRLFTTQKAFDRVPNPVLLCFNHDFIHHSAFSASILIHIPTFSMLSSLFSTHTSVKCRASRLSLSGFSFLNCLTRNARLLYWLRFPKEPSSLHGRVCLYPHAVIFHRQYPPHPTVKYPKASYCYRLCQHLSAHLWKHLPRVFCYCAEPLKFRSQPTPNGSFSKPSFSSLPNRKIWIFSPSQTILFTNVLIAALFCSMLIVSKDFA